MSSKRPRQSATVIDHECFYVRCNLMGPDYGARDRGGADVAPALEGYQTDNGRELWLLI